MSRHKPGDKRFATGAHSERRTTTDGEIAELERRIAWMREQGLDTRLQESRLEKLKGN